jgi:hypothetical protein
MSVVVRDSNGHDLGQIVPKLGTNSYISVQGNSTSVQSHAFAANVSLIRVAVEDTTGHVHFRIGADPTCDLTVDPIIPGGTIEYLSVTPGHKIAFNHAKGSTIKVSVTDVVS